MIDIALYASYALVLIALVGAVVLPLIQAFGQPKNLAKIGLGVLVIGVIYLVAWAISGNEVTQIYTNFGVDASLSKIVGGMLIMVYILMATLVLGLVYSEVSKVFK